VVDKTRELARNLPGSDIADPLHREGQTSAKGQPYGQRYPARAARAWPNRLPKFSPDIAVAVVSSESARAQQAKVKLARTVWAAYFELRLAVVHDHAGVRELSGGQRLEAAGVLPGSSVPAAAFFCRSDLIGGER
jgi:hypothetical protein